MGTIFGLLLLALLCVMSIVEIARYYRQRESAELPYPRRRLSRRLGIGIIFGIVILLVTFWPKMTPLMDLTFIGLLFVFLRPWRPTTIKTAALRKSFRHF